MAVPFSAVVLAGGTGARLGGADKASLEHDGRTLLEHSLAALSDAHEVVVVGPAVTTSRPVIFAREAPARGGPAAGLLAGRDALGEMPAWLGVLAVDMPYVRATTFRRLRDAALGSDGAFLADPTGRRQLAGVLDPARLAAREAAVAPGLAQRHGLPLRTLLDGLELVLVASHGDEATDIDTWADVRELRTGPASREAPT